MSCTLRSCRHAVLGSGTVPLSLFVTLQHKGRQAAEQAISPSGHLVSTQSESAVLPESRENVCWCAHLLAANLMKYMLLRAIA